MKFRKSRLIIDLMTRIRVVVEENMESDMSNWTRTLHVKTKARFEW